MSVFDRFLVHLTTVLLATLLVGVLARGRHRACLSFVLYVAAVVASSILIGMWPERFYVFDFYLLKEIVHNLLKFAVALELAYRTFRGYPGALSSARVLIGLVLVATLLVTLSAPPVYGESDLTGELHARVLNGTIWLLTVIAVLILWYRIPVDPFHKAILTGFVPYLLVFSIGMRAITEMGYVESKPFQLAHAIAYNVLVAYWNYAAWRTDPVRGVAPGELARQSARREQPA